MPSSRAETPRAKPGGGSPPGRASRERPRRELPIAFDWRDQCGCTPIKDQGSCGSCGAFSTVVPLECNILIKDGLEENLSEQWL